MKKEDFTLLVKIFWTIMLHSNEKYMWCSGRPHMPSATPIGQKKEKELGHLKGLGKAKPLKGQGTFTWRQTKKYKNLQGTTNERGEVTGPCWIPIDHQLNELIKIRNPHFLFMAYMHKFYKCTWAPS